MFEYNFSFEEFSLVAQSILTRIDFVSDILSDWEMGDSKLHEHYVNELSSLRALYEKLTVSKSK